MEGQGQVTLMTYRKVEVSLDLLDWVVDLQRVPVQLLVAEPAPKDDVTRPVFEGNTPRLVVDKMQ